MANFCRRDSIHIEGPLAKVSIPIWNAGRIFELAPSHIPAPHPSVGQLYEHRESLQGIS